MSEKVERVPLLERGAKGDWSSFEAQLFNLLGKEMPREFLFSKRLLVTQLMLEAYDRAVMALEAEERQNG